MMTSTLFSLLLLQHDLQSKEPQVTSEGVLHKYR